MTRKEKINFFVITIVVLLLFLLIIAGGVVLGISNNPWLLIIGMICFVGFGFSFPIIGRIKRKLSFKVIEKSQNTTEEIANITSVWLGWHSYKGSRVKALTLNIKCDINGVKSQSWYKFEEEELKNVETEKVMESGTGADSNRVYYRTEITQESLDNLFKRGDSVIVKYIVDKPKYCIILKKVNKIVKMGSEPYIYQKAAKQIKTIDMPAVFQTELGDKMLTDLYSKKTLEEIKSFLDDIKSRRLPSDLINALQNEAGLCIATIDMPAVFQTELGSKMLTELYSKNTIEEIKSFLDDIKSRKLPSNLINALQNEAELCIVSKPRR